MKCCVVLAVDYYALGPLAKLCKYAVLIYANICYRWNAPIALNLYLPIAIAVVG